MKSPLLSKVLLSAFSLSILLIINGCGKTDTTTPAVLATLTTNGLIVNLTSTGAQSGGVITNNGGADVTAAGVCYSSSNQTPTTSDSKTSDTPVTDPAGTNSFTSTLTGLTAATTYYLRAYATNSAGTAYGVVITFKTNNVTGINTTVSTLAGSIAGGFFDGSGPSALFANPQGVVADAQGNVYVADGFNNRIRKITPAGVTTTYAGDGNAGFLNGPAATAEFYAPQGIAIDAQGNLFVADLGNNVIRKISTAGVVSTFCGNGTRGYVNGADTLAEFNNPQGLCVDASGNVFVADRSNNLVRKITAAGVASNFAGSGAAYYFNGTGSDNSFNGPKGVAVDASGNVYVADAGNYSIRKITPAQVVTTVAGSPVQTTIVGTPAGISIDSKGNLYITDQGGRILEITTSNILYILAGTASTAGYVDGTGTAAKFSSPQGITIDNKGNIYVADYNNNIIRTVTGAIQ
ncbi:NHL repeat-containing protein [Mucilaginibacter sp. X5P1]|uniref:NHL repeat-containing protein n=1 Tax=Mucilaginibacter sp. X5P1 TaxID=2723088 RepID=UPI00161849F2|nr:NHL repeat-containing protein [Mucilaginibacter sp. X5P1]MBB6139107.1 sugar lactone lactonase YvrE [Mucilaginibacter sp. X5P1]